MPDQSLTEMIRRLTLAAVPFDQNLHASGLQTTLFDTDDVSHFPPF